MITLVIAASAILTLVFLFKKHQLEVRGGKRLAYHFFDKSLEFLIPFTIISTLFFLLSLLVANTSNETTIQRLILFEKLVGFFKWFVSIFKLGALAVVILLSIFYLLSLTRIPSKYTTQLVSFFKNYRKVIKTVYMIVIILFSFTFFGTQTGTPEARLRFRIKEAEGNYGELRQEVKDAVSQEVGRKLVEKIKKSLPPDYRKDLDDQDQFYIHLSGLRSAYQGFKASYGRQDPGAETIIKDSPPPDPPPNPGGSGEDATMDPMAAEHSPLIQARIKAPAIVLMESIREAMGEPAGSNHQRCQEPGNESSIISLKKVNEPLLRPSQPL
jgi:hypothetical protein